MKKILLYILFFSLLFLSGCEKNSAKTASERVFQMDGQTTADGVAPGDGPAKFQKAYGSYSLQVAWNDTDSALMVMSPDKIPYDEPITTIIASLFIDGKPVSETQFCREQRIEPEQMHSLLSSPDFLRAHDVIYRYLDFDWEDGVIASISSEELNYNETFETPRLP